MATQNFGHGLNHVGFRLAGWKAVAILVLVLAIIAAIIIFALSLMLVLAPVLLVSSAAYYFSGGRRRRFSIEAEKSATGNIIDGQFSVVEKPHEISNLRN